MHLAAILSSRADYPMAMMAAAAMRRMSWSAAVLVDPAEWTAIPAGAVPARIAPERGHGMYGNSVAIGIMDALASLAEPFDVVTKLDCDVSLSFAASRWLASVGKMPRAFRLGSGFGPMDGRGWGGCWSARGSAIAAAARFVGSLPRCRCPEGHLCLTALHMASGGIEHSEEFAVGKWPDAAGAAVLTLPMRMRGDGRRDAAAAMFDSRKTNDTIRA